MGWCVVVGRPHADVWKLIWAKWEDLGQEVAGNTALRCKAHRSKAQVMRLDEPGQDDAAGNAVADRWAKEGRALTKALAESKQCRQLGRRCCKQHI